ncbi:MAG: hypothetical protein ACRENU_06580 [Gemmatimonadaceae bacterium]
MYLTRILLAIFFGALLGTTLELVFLEHYEDVWQYAPLVASALGFAIGGWYARSPTRTSLRAFKAVLGLFVVTGIVGLVLHYRANVEFEVERDSALGGMRLFWEALGGAMPALAPGTMVLLAAIGYAVIVSRQEPLASPRA